MGSGRKIEDWFDRRIAESQNTDKIYDGMKKSISSRIRFPSRGSDETKDDSESPEKEIVWGEGSDEAPSKKVPPKESRTRSKKVPKPPQAKKPTVKGVREVKIGEKVSGLFSKIPIPNFKKPLVEKREKAEEVPSGDPRYEKIRTGDAADFVVDNPILTLGIMVAITIFLFFQAVSLDFGSGKTIPLKNNLNIHGETTVYLPSDHETTKILEEVREYWSTDIIVVFVQIANPDENSVNITNPAVLRELSYVEESLDPDKSDRGMNDEVVYCFSISTLIKEVNSTAPRLYNATIKNLAAFGSQIGGVEIQEEYLRQYINMDMAGEYAIPNNEDQIDTIVNNLPENVREKIVRDTNDDGIWDTAVCVIGVVEEAGDDPKPMIAKAELAVESRPQQGNITTMTVTGTLPLTDWGTEKAFYYYGILMPLAMTFLVFVILYFHRSMKAVFIAGVPTGSSVIWIYGLLAMFNVIVTPTIILLGPVLLALGMSYGMHIANRFSQETVPSFTERARITLKTTGNAVLMSAITTMVGFASLSIGDLKPVTTVGISLTGGILFCFLLTYVMSPVLCILTKYEKKSLESQGKRWEVVSKIPTKNSKKILVFFAIVILLSVSTYPLVEKDTDLMAYAPNRAEEWWGTPIDGFDKIEVMKTYSNEFDSGALGMVLLTGQFRSDNYQDDSQDPVAHLKEIEYIEDDINAIVDEHPDLPVNALGIVSIMRSIGAKGTISTLNIPIVGDIIPLEINLSQSGNFWSLLNSPTVSNNKPLQKFLLNVFYDTISNESKGMVINEYREGEPSYYEKTLIYVDMPVLSDKEGHEAVALVNEIAVEKPHGGVVSTKLTGVAAIAVAVNDLLLAQQLQSILMSIVLVFLVLSGIFKSPKMGAITTLPVVMVLGFMPGVMFVLGVPLNLATVMIGSTVIGAGVDFSVHITQRMMEEGLNEKAIEKSVSHAGPALFEATLITLGGLSAAFFVPMPAVFSFILVIMILLLLAATAAILILPSLFAVYVTHIRTREAVQEHLSQETAQDDWDVEWEVD